MAKLVAIGDSLTQGFQSLAIQNPGDSFPSIIARAMGLGASEMAVPDFSGKGGLPCNVEWIARELEHAYGASLSTFEWLSAVFRIADLLDQVEDYWEHGPGSRKAAPRRYHNLAVWGFEVGDAYNITASSCLKQVQAQGGHDLLPIPSVARDRTALRVLNPAMDAALGGENQIKVAKKIRQNDGGIENLIVWLGANNCLGTVVDLEIRQTGTKPPGPRSGLNLWTADAFEEEYAKLAAEIQTIEAGKVFVATVPHVTIPPITRGVMSEAGRLPEGERYFDYYTRFFIQDKRFDPFRDPHLTKAEAKKIDDCVDDYNRIIREQAQKHQWHVVDTCQVLDDLAVRRNHGTPTYDLPDGLDGLSIRFFEIGSGGTVKNGGLISLDGVHPTTCGYAIVAQEFIRVMKRAGTEFQRDIDFHEVRRWDSLVTRPPKTLDDVFGMLELLERRFHLSRWMKPTME